MELRAFVRERRDQLLTLGVVAVAAGFVAIGLGWFGAAGKDSIPEQFPYLLSGGVAGLGLLLVGAALIITQSFRRDHDRVHAELAHLREEIIRQERQLEQAASGSTDQAIVLAGRSSYHQPDCHLVSERDSSDAIPVNAAVEQGLEPCRVCEPPKAA